MYQKIESAAQTAILEMYGMGSLLPGDEELCGNFDDETAGGKKEEKQAAAPAGEMPYVEQGEVCGRIAHLSVQAQADILEMSRIMGGYPVVAYISQDGLNAGVICSREWMWQYWEIYQKFAGCFWRSHVEICTVFENELRLVGRNYGR